MLEKNVESGLCLEGSWSRITTFSVGLGVWGWVGVDG